MTNCSLTTVLAGNPEEDMRPWKAPAEGKGWEVGQWVDAVASWIPRAETRCDG